MESMTYINIFKSKNITNVDTSIRSHTHDMVTILNKYYSPKITFNYRFQNGEYDNNTLSLYITDLTLHFKDSRWTEYFETKVSVEAFGNTYTTEERYQIVYMIPQEDKGIIKSIPRFPIRSSTVWGFPSELNMYVETLIRYKE